MPVFGRFMTAAEVEKARQEIKQTIINQRETVMFVSDVAAMLGWKEQTVYNKIAQDLIPYHRLPGCGKSTFFLKSELIAFIKSNGKKTQ